MQDLEAKDYFRILKSVAVVVVVVSGFSCPCPPKHMWITTCLLWNCSHPDTALKKDYLYVTRVQSSGVPFPFSCIKQHSFIYSYTNIKPFFAEALKA